MYQDYTGIHLELNTQTIPKLIATTLFVLLAATSFPAQADVNAWPLFEKSEESSTFLYPLYVNEGDFKMVFPF